VRYFHLSERNKDECKAIVDFCVSIIWKDYAHNQLTVIVNDTPTKRRRSKRRVEYSGRAYGPKYDPDTDEGFVRPKGFPAELCTDYIITVSLSPDLEKILPTTEWGGGHATTQENNGWPVHRLKTWQEVFCCVTAHELWHTIQYLNDMARSEIDCERCAEIVLKEWRKNRDKAHFDCISH
jgi:hypothetical protein